jgi:hypothetical protein
VKKSPAAWPGFGIAESRYSRFSGVVAALVFVHEMRSMAVR